MNETVKLPKWINEVIELVSSTNYERDIYSYRHISVVPVLKDAVSGEGYWKVIITNETGFKTFFVWKLVDISRKYKLNIDITTDDKCYDDVCQSVVKIVLRDPLHAPEREKLDEELERKLKALEG